MTAMVKTATQADAESGEEKRLPSTCRKHDVIDLVVLIRSPPVKLWAGRTYLLDFRDDSIISTDLSRNLS